MSEERSEEKNLMIMMLEKERDDQTLHSVHTLFYKYFCLFTGFRLFHRQTQSENIYKYTYKPAKKEEVF